MLTDLTERLDEYHERVAALRGFLAFDKLRDEMAALEAKTQAADFWNDNVSAQKVIAQVNERKGWIESWEALDKAEKNLRELVQMAEEAGDESMRGDVEHELNLLDTRIAELELRNMLRSVDDEKSALLTIHSGAGGTEAQDWAEMLLRMYTRWCERNGYKVQLADLQDGEGAGIKSERGSPLGSYFAVRC